MKIYNSDFILNIIGYKRSKAQLPLEEQEKDLKNARVEFTHLLHDIFFILLGVLSATVGLKSFLLPNMFIDGGVMGISLIIAEVSKIPLSMLIVAVNIPFIILGFSTISKQFAIKSIISIILLAITVHFLSFPVITHDKLLIAVFGGFFLGAGIGSTIRGGAVIDGTEILAVFVSRKTSLTIGDVIMVFNIIIFASAAYVFSVEISLYAMLTYLAASKTVDFIVEGMEEYIGVTIISNKHEEIRKMLVDHMGRGVTIYQGSGGYNASGASKTYQVIYTIKSTVLEAMK